MAWAYYAVRKGKTTGIVNSWAECQEMVNGFSHAEFKGFNSEEAAKAYMGGAKTEDIVANDTSVQKPTDGDTVNIYARGTYLENFVDMGIILESADKVFKFFGQVHCRDYKNMRGFAGEILATMAALQLCREIGFCKVSIVYAYDGIEKWVDGSWATHGGLSTEYLTLVNYLRTNAVMRYNFIKRSKQNKEPGVVDAERMIARSKVMTQYVDLTKILRCQLMVKDVPLYSIS